MARKSNENLRDMTLRQLDAYATTNPAEGLRIASECKKTKNFAAKQYLLHQKGKVVDMLFPESKIRGTE